MLFSIYSQTENVSSPRVSLINMLKHMWTRCRYMEDVFERPHGFFFFTVSPYTTPHHTARDRMRSKPSRQRAIYTELRVGRTLPDGRVASGSRQRTQTDEAGSYEDFARLHLALCLQMQGMMVGMEQSDGEHLALHNPKCHNVRTGSSCLTSLRAWPRPS